MSDATHRDIVDHRKGTYREEDVPDHENQIIQRRVLSLEMALTPPERAKYELSLCILDSHSMAPAMGSVEVFTAATNGFSESWHQTKLYWCPGRRLGVNDCERLLIPDSNFSVNHTCPCCGNTWKAEVMMGEIIARLPRQKWAQMLAQQVESLGRFVDIRAKVFTEGARVATYEDLSRKGDGSRVEKVRRLAKRVYYPYRNLIRDLNNGSTLESRMVFLLNACSTTYYV